MIQTAHLTASCRDPESFNVHQLHFTSDNITATVKFVLPSNSDILHGYGTLYKVPEHLINIRYETEFKLGECIDYRRRVFREELAHEPISVGSTCPWYYRKNIDENRLPNILYDVECICDNCIGHRFGRTCQKIYTYINVYRRTGCLNGIYEYSTIVEPISVGCSCVRDPKSIGRQTMHS
ncbi:IL17D [Mytilus edulis]|uniref:Interleukin 17F n=2 Tax=Mytilus TaxID=6548 RepID=A0A8B6E7I2_MYTGA|nr:IL17D [Mytilus edulis]VDI30261.1 interleukin 17F [Mytilus galloprovincialis]